MEAVRGRTNPESKSKKTTFVAGAAILGLAGLVCKIIGALFRIPLYNLMGDGMAYYEAAYPCYSWLLVVSSAGIPTAISRMVAERVAVGDYCGAKRVFRKAELLLTGIGVGTGLILLLGAPLFARMVNVGDGAEMVFRALSPALLIVSVMCAYRGYLQGLQCMTGTAVSQLTEQVVKLAAGLYFAKKLLARGAAYAIAGTMLGICLSEFLALLVIVLFYLFKMRSVPVSAPLEDRESGREIIREILMIAVPVTIGASIMPLTGIIDSALIVRTLKAIGLSEADANMRYVALRTNVTTVINMPAVLTSALAASLVPAVGAARRQGNKKEVRSIIRTAIKLAMGIGLPCAAGLFVLAEEVIDFLYTIDAERLAVAASIMRVASVQVIFLSLVQTMTGVLQGIGKQNIPVQNLGLGAVAKVLVMLTVMRIPSVNILGAALSTAVCYTAAGLLDLFRLKKATGIRLSFQNMFLKPAAASVCMGAAVYGTKLLLAKAVSSVAIITMGSVAVGIVLYAVLLLVFRFFNEEDCGRIPGGKYIMRLSRIGR